MIVIQTSVNTSYQKCLEFVIVCSNHWLKIEVTARQKSVFPRCWLKKAWGSDAFFSLAACESNQLAVPRTRHSRHSSVGAAHPRIFPDIYDKSSGVSNHVNNNTEPSPPLVNGTAHSERPPSPQKGPHGHQKYKNTTRSLPDAETGKRVTFAPHTGPHRQTNDSKRSKSGPNTIRWCPRLKRRMYKGGRGGALFGVHLASDLESSRILHYQQTSLPVFLGSISNSVCKLSLCGLLVPDFSFRSFFYLNYKFISIRTVGKHFVSGCPQSKSTSGPKSHVIDNSSHSSALVPGTVLGLIYTACSDCRIRLWILCFVHHTLVKTDVCRSVFLYGSPMFPSCTQCRRYAINVVCFLLDFSASERTRPTTGKSVKAKFRSAPGSALARTGRSTRATGTVRVALFPRRRFRSCFAGLDKNHNLNWPFRQPAFQFYLPEAILTYPKVQSTVKRAIKIFDHAWPSAGKFTSPRLSHTVFVEPCFGVAIEWLPHLLLLLLLVLFAYLDSFWFLLWHFCLGLILFVCFVVGCPNGTPNSSQLDPSYKIKTCIGGLPNDTAKSSQLARNHSIVWWPRSHITITKQLGESWREVGKGGQTVENLARVWRKFELDQIQANSSQLKPSGWPNVTQLHRSCELDSSWLELGVPFGQGFMQFGGQEVGPRFRRSRKSWPNFRFTPQVLWQ